MTGVPLRNGTPEQIDPQQTGLADLAARKLVAIRLRAGVQASGLGCRFGGNALPHRKKPYARPLERFFGGLLPQMPYQRHLAVKSGLINPS